MISGEASEHKEDLIFLNFIIKSAKLKPVIDKIFTFEQTTEAHRYVKKGHNKGKVVITMEHSDKTS